MKKEDFLLIVLFIFLSCSTHKPKFKGTSFNKHTNLNGTGFTKQRLDSLTMFIKNNLETTGMLILKDGKILFEYGDIKELSYNASVRKSILSIMYGKYIDNGTINLNQTIGEIGIDEDKGLLEIEKKATIKDIITARSGVFYKPANSGYDKDNILKRGSVIPGEYFVYNNWDFNVAGAILERKTGNSIYQEMEDQFATSLGFQDWNIKNQKKKFNKQKSRYPAYHMYISIRDMAKIGQLMLNEGKWNGKQLVSKEWIKKITATVTPTKIINERYNLNESSPFQFSYGYMWWIVDNFKQHPDFKGSYAASGFGGQFIIVIPKLNIVVVHKTKIGILNYLGLKNDVTPNQFWQLLYDYVITKKK